ncbi:hypothetical protein Dimus_023762 [Dionaea muscipula]
MSRAGASFSDEDGFGSPCVMAEDEMGKTNLISGYFTKKGILNSEAGSSLPTSNADNPDISVPISMTICDTSIVETPQKTRRIGINDNELDVNSLELDPETKGSRPVMKAAMPLPREVGGSMMLETQKIDTMAVPGLRRGEIVPRGRKDGGGEWKMVKGIGARNDSVRSENGNFPIQHSKFQVLESHHEKQGEREAERQSEGTESGMITVQSILHSIKQPSSPRPEIKVEIAFPVSSDPVARTSSSTRVAGEACPSNSHAHENGKAS